MCLREEVKKLSGCLFFSLTETEINSLVWVLTLWRTEVKHRNVDDEWMNWLIKELTAAN